ncbi:predicted protein [Chaetoceros tenuissimus]|uniref:Uncharacterized protein n=1 Tax=Chaetoceros tenuissimus TaxID=426638 RepID=A0AAD3CUI4_9STRA|nr:predicted protein [Chaetoceros tenuissimus]
MTTSTPRTQTGLVPTTYQNKVDRRNSMENWKKLPPQPPKESYRFRGDKVMKTPKSKTRAPTTKSIGRTHRKSKKKEWDSSSLNESYEEVYSIDPEKKEVLDSSRKASLDYVRESGMRRNQLDTLQRMLDFEIKEEDSLFVQLDESTCTTDEDSVQKVKPQTFTHELNRIKKSLFDRLDALEKQYEPATILSRRTTDQKEKNDDDQDVVLSMGDASTLPSLGISETTSTLQSSSIDPFSSTSIECTHHPSFSTTSTWEILSTDQHERIYNRAKELYESKYKRGEIDDVSRHEHLEDDVELGGLDDNDELIQETKGASENSDDTQCRYDLTAICQTISKGIFSSHKNSSEAPQCEEFLSQMNVKETKMPQHPYNLPLSCEYKSILESKASV